MVTASLCPHCSSSESEFWNLSTAHYRSHFLLHPATQHSVEQTRQRYTQQLLNQPLLLFFCLFICRCSPMTRLLLLLHITATLPLIFTFQSFVLRFRLPIPPFPLSYHTSFLSLFFPPPCLIFHFAALLLISQRACGLTEMQGSDGGCQTVSTYLFTEIHTCIHITSRNQQEMKGVNSKAEPYYHFKCLCIYVA